MDGLQFILLAYLCYENVLQWKGFADIIAEWEREPVSWLSFLPGSGVGG